MLRLALQGEQPSPKEKSRFEQIADELDAILVDPRRDAKYFGNVEIAEFVPGEAKIISSVAPMRMSSPRNSNRGSKRLTGPARSG